MRQPPPGSRASDGSMTLSFASGTLTGWRQVRRSVLVRCTITRGCPQSSNTPGTTVRNMWYVPSSARTMSGAQCVAFSPPYSGGEVDVGRADIRPVRAAVGRLGDADARAVYPRHARQPLRRRAAVRIEHPPAPARRVPHEHGVGGAVVHGSRNSGFGGCLRGGRHGRSAAHPASAHSASTRPAKAGVTSRTNCVSLFVRSFARQLVS